MSISSLPWGVLFSAIGLGYFVYGKKQKTIVPLVCGIALMVCPYVISDAIALAAVGAALTAVPFFLRR